MMATMNQKTAKVDIFYIGNEFKVGTLKVIKTPSDVITFIGDSYKQTKKMIPEPIVDSFIKVCTGRVLNKRYRQCILDLMRYVDEIVAEGMEVHFIHQDEKPTTSNLEAIIFSNGLIFVNQNSSLKFRTKNVFIEVIEELVRCIKKDDTEEKHQQALEALVSCFQKLTFIPLRLEGIDPEGAYTDEDDN